MATCSEIPVVDLGGDLGHATGPPSAAESASAGRLVAAAGSHGFVFVRTGMPDSSSFGRVFELSRVLFDSPAVDKARCSIGKNNRGWAAPHSETLDPASQRIGDYKEAFNFGPLGSPPLQPVPAAIEEHRLEIEQFRQVCHQLCLRILYLLGVGLDIDPPHFIADTHLPSAGPSDSTLRFLRYPPLSDCPGASADQVRAGAHSDYGSITLLFRLRGQGGLQVLTRTGAWASVPVHPLGTEADELPPVLVNVGDLLQFWTNGRLRSTVHRVVFSDDATVGPRYSIAYFCHPAHQTPISPLPLTRTGIDLPVPVNSEVSASTSGVAITAHEYLMMKLAATFGLLYTKTE